MAKVTVTLRGFQFDVDPATKVMSRVHIDYDVTRGAVVTSKVVDRAPDDEATAALWRLLHLLGFLEAEAIPRPDPPLPAWDPI